MPGWEPTSRQHDAADSHVALELSEATASSTSRLPATAPMLNLSTNQQSRSVSPSRGASEHQDSLAYEVNLNEPSTLSRPNLKVLSAVSIAYIAGFAGLGCIFAYWKPTFAFIYPLFFLPLALLMDRAVKTSFIGIGGRLLMLITEYDRLSN